MYKRTKFLSIFTFLLIFILSFVFNTKKSFAKDCFFEDFSDLNNWNSLNDNTNGNSWFIENGVLVGEVFSGQSSFLIANSFEDLSNYTIEFDLLNKTGIDQNILFRASNDLNKYYVLNIRYTDPFWPGGGEIILWKYNFGYERLFTYVDTLGLLTKNELHKIKIDLKDSNIKIIYDLNLVVDFNDLVDPILKGSFGFNNWGGSYSASSSKNLFDNLSINNCQYKNNKPKIIIIPGFGASWNSEAIVYDHDVDNDQWKMTPFVKNYDGLINALKENNLEEYEDYYVWNYDWRKPLEDIVTDLNSFIDQKVKSDEKVILVGHSLGGLTARIWAEDNKNDSRLEKVVTLGSPHLGAVDAYEAWNGGQISDLSKVSSIAFKVLLELKGLTKTTNMETVRDYVPSVKDLLPTFNFVTKNGMDFTNQLEVKNDYLKDKNNDGVNSGINLKLYAGNGFKTANTINLKENNIFDKILGVWPDGRINNFSYTDSGDGTVLIKSANYSKNDFLETESNHGEIVDKTINQVMTEIGLSQVEFVGENKDLKNNLVVFVGSPAMYSVRCDNDSPVLENDGFVVIKNKNYKTCSIDLIGTGNGLVHIVSGNTNDNNWSYWEKDIENEEIISINIDPKNGQIVDNKNNILFLKSIIRENINSLLLLNINNKDLKEALKNLDKNQPKQLIKNIFDFREKNGERIISQEIINNANSWLSFLDKCSKNEAIKGFKIISNYRDLIEGLISNQKKFKISVGMAVDYQEIIDLIEINQKELKNNNYNKVCGRNFLILNYGNGILKKNYGNGAKKWLLQDSDL